MLYIITMTCLCYIKGKHTLYTVYSDAVFMVIKGIQFMIGIQIPGMLFIRHGIQKSYK